jgi:hypothetical protein
MYRFNEYKGVYDTFSTHGDTIQIIGTAVTFLAVIVALFGERLWRWWDQPKISVSFNKSSDRCFRSAIVPQCSIQDEGSFLNVSKQYFRFKIANNGGPALKVRIKVDVLDENMNEVPRFEPSALSWILGSATIDLARGEAEYTNFLSQILNYPEIQNRITVEINDKNPRGIAWDRPLIAHNFRITIYGDNISPKTYSVKFTPAKNLLEPGELEIKN